MAMDTTNEQFTFPVQMRAIADAGRIATLNDILRNGRVPDVSVLDEHPPFFFGGEISSTRLDAYFTHMRLSSLQNYAQEAAEGVAFLPGHNHRHLPIGYSLTGNITQQGDDAQVKADFYTLRNLQIGEYHTDGLTVSLRGGLTRDMSIGWYGGERICDICNQPYWGGDCWHVAGLKYDIKPENSPAVRIICTVGIDDAHLAEVSGVYDGATPGAMIEKVYELANQGALSVNDVRLVEIAYRLDAAETQRMLALPAMQKKHAGVDIRTPGQMPGKDERMNEQQFTRMKDVLVRAGVVEADQRDALDEDAALAGLDKLATRVAELEPRALDGDTYRNDLVAEALAEGVRAYGEKFDNATYEEQLRTSPLKVIKRMRDDWKTVGDARFAGGRSTTEGDPAGEGAKTVELRAPVEQYA